MGWGFSPALEGLERGVAGYGLQPFIEPRYDTLIFSDRQFSIAGHFMTAIQFPLNPAIFISAVYLLCGLVLVVILNTSLPRARWL